MATSYYKLKAEDGEKEKFAEMTPNTEEGHVDWRALEKTPLNENALLRELLLKGDWKNGLLTRYTKNAEGKMVYDGLLLSNGAQVGQIVEDLDYGKVVSIGDFEDGCADVVLEKDGKIDESCVLLASGRFVSDKGFGSHENLKTLVANMYNLPGNKEVPSTRALADVSFGLLSPTVPKRDAEKLIDNMATYICNFTYEFAHETAGVYTELQELKDSKGKMETFADLLGLMARHQALDEKFEEIKQRSEEISDEMDAAIGKARVVQNSFMKLMAMKNE